jgi:hypothetical protein
MKQPMTDATSPPAAISMGMSQAVSLSPAMPRATTTTDNVMVAMMAST